MLYLLKKCKRTSHVNQIYGHIITTNVVSAQLLTCVSSNFTTDYHTELVSTHIRKPDIFTYNTIIRSCVASSNVNKGLSLYVEMKRNGDLGDNYTYPILLKGCGLKHGLLEGKQIHGEVVKYGFDLDLFVVNGLICMYCRCGEISFGRSVFDGSLDKDLVSWNSILSGFIGCGDMVEAQKLFDDMPERNVVSWSVMIDGYAKKSRDLVRARELFDSMPLRDLVSWNSMIHAYTKIGDMMEARQLFDVMPKKSLISWSIMIDGFAQNENPKESLNIFRRMLSEGFRPDRVSVVGAIVACGQLGALGQGRWIHTFMTKHKIKTDMVVQTALVDMYMKCGSINEAISLFNSMSRRSTVSYNVMIVGLGMNGLVDAALNCFTRMVDEGVLADDLIFLGILTACSHAGYVDKGMYTFDMMRRVCLIEPKLEHYGCLVDLPGRAGKLDEAKKLVETMPMKPNSALLGSLLWACKRRKNAAFAEFVLQRLEMLEDNDFGVHVLMSNLYADMGSWKDVERIRKNLQGRSMKKDAGKSVIEVDGHIEEFSSGVIERHDQSKHMKTIISSLHREVHFCSSIAKSHH